ncbi:MAG: transglutaminase-like domain-containing protein, partial [Chitinophagaceae bacterium]
MKYLLYILLLFASPGFSQSSQISKEEDPEALAKKITAGCTSDREKVNRIFRWITGNISYRVKTGQHKVLIGTAAQKYSKGEVDDDAPLKPLNERVAETVLQRKEAVCDGYARLFSTLCQY